MTTLNLNFDSQNIFFRCVEDSSETIMITDTEGHLVYVNPAWTRIYGYSKNEALGKTPRLLHSGHQKRIFYSRLWESIRDPKRGFWKGEVINRTKEGSLIPVLLTITPFKSEQNEVLGFMGIAVDIREQKELEAKLIHHDRLASIGLLASGLAHEVGTPLGVIRGRAELLLMQAKDPTFSKGLEVIMGQIDRISKLIRSLLSISRSSPQIHLKPVNVLEVVNEVISLVTQTLQNDVVDIRVLIPPQLSVIADSNRLEQVLLNLVMNSIYAIRKSIIEGPKRDHLLSISSEIKNSSVSLKIQDSGCGISQEHMKHLFEPFFTTKAPGEGTGLGLAITSKIMEELRGEIAVESTPEVGTIFTLYLEEG